MVDEVLRQAEKMLQDGAALLDIGGQSTRPGSQQVGPEEEMQRVTGIIEAVSLRFPDAILSVDTYHASVARQAVEAGAAMINDISGGNMDPAMLETAGSLKVPYVCMHTKGTPQDMQHHAVYEDVTREVLDHFIRKIDACKKAGIQDVIMDPGFGFAKTAGHNFELLRNLQTLRILGCAIMVGLSRKSTIYKTLGTDAAGALNGTTVMNTIALLKGAHILRVHDVKEACEAVQLVSAL